MYFDSRMSIKIPIFPLPLVLLPGEKLPLHIFEEKYKKMIEYCLKNNKNFGIVNSKNKDLLTIGCIASIDQLFGSDVYDNNEYDILVTGNERFIVKGYDDSKIYRRDDLFSFALVFGWDCESTRSDGQWKRVGDDVAVGEIEDGVHSRRGREV